MLHKTLLGKWHTDEKTGFRLRHVKSDTEMFRPHDHDYYEIFLVLGGTAKHNVGSSITTVSAGDLIFIRDFDVHDYTGYERDGLEFLNLAFTRENFRAVVDFLGYPELREALISPPLPPIKKLSAEETARLHLKLASLLADRGETHMLALSRRILADILLDYFTRGEAQSPGAPYWLKSAYEKMRAPKNFLLGTQRFFELCDKTREHATRQLSLYYQMTPAEYVSGLKLSYAAGLLRNSNLTVSEIAYRSGFNNLSSFYARFYKKYGVSPKEYRKESAT